MVGTLHDLKLFGYYWLSAYHTFTYYPSWWMLEGMYVCSENTQGSCSSFLLSFQMLLILTCVHKQSLFKLLRI